MVELMPADHEVVNLLRRQPTMTVEELGRALGVTGTAVRQRLTRLMACGYVERRALRQGRGRPTHYYSLSPKGCRASGANFADLAAALWLELRAIADPQVRRGLIERVAHRLADHYRMSVQGESVEKRMEQVAALMQERQVPFSVQREGTMPVLLALACPYPELAERDRGVCAMERQLMSDMLGQPMRLTRCRLDGDSCCSFEGVVSSEERQPGVVAGTSCASVPCAESNN